MSHRAGALASAEVQVAAVRDDPAARLALMARLFHGPTGSAPRHLPFRRAALSFMRWQAQRKKRDGFAPNISEQASLTPRHHALPGGDAESELSHLT